jgi:hypothetical protein
MRNRILILYLAVLYGTITMSSGCASARPSIGDISTLPGPEESVLIIQRPLKFYASLIRVSIFVDGAERFILKNGQTGRLILENGIHEVVGVDNFLRKKNQSWGFLHSIAPKRIAVNSQQLTLKANILPGSETFIIGFDQIKKEALKK